MRHGLFLGASRLRLLAQLHTAGVRGVAVVLFDEPCTFVDAGLAEFYTDPHRVFTDRVRLTPTGERYAAALCPDERNGDDQEAARVRRRDPQGTRRRGKRRHCLITQ